MRRIITLILLCWACKHEVTWSGIPDHDRAVCGSFFETQEAVCILDGDAYTCVSNAGCNPDHFECALVEKPPSSISRKKLEIERLRRQQQQQVMP